MTVHGDRRGLTFSLSLRPFVFGTALGPSDCWIRSNFFFCKETTYYHEDTIGKVKTINEVGDTNLLHALAHYIASSNDWLCLPNSVYSIKSLLLGHRIPLRLHEMNTTSCGQVNAASR